MFKLNISAQHVCAYEYACFNTLKKKKKAEVCFVRLSLTKTLHKNPQLDFFFFFLKIA